MNVCFLITDISWRGGTNKMTCWLSNAISRYHSVFVLSLHKELEGQLFALSTNVNTYIINECNQAIGYFAYIRRIHEYLNTNNIDLLISVDTGMSIYSIPASKFLKTKVINWEHSNFYNNWGSKYFAFYRRLAAKYSDAMVVLTERDKWNYEDHIKNCVPVTVIPNPANKKSHNYDISSKIILSAGLLGKIKRFDRIVSIGKVVFSKHSDWKWIVCGDGPERMKLESAVNEAGLQNHILFRGSVSDMDAQYAISAIYVLTSEMEGLPMVLLEAKSHGLPIVSFDIETGPSDIVRDGVNGYLVESGDVDTMAEKICQLIEDEALRQKFSENTVLDMDKFDEERIVEEWEQLIRSL